ncbi:hypothetical protein PG997_012684 [Apiospora hydei]|uniref:AB hydrolase-1 domain-containing protein n=1 Tax=Apiospora hydei TaxID=1337664 RepID=A0ABR1V440_9PEZI
MTFPYHIKEHKIPSQHVREYPRATAHSQDDVLYLAIKQYIPKDNPDPQPGDVTIIGTHANGFPKELYEALWAELYESAKSNGFRIRSIWIADISNQGYSGILNEHTMGDDPSWNDHARDLLHMINVFRADMPRPIIGLGHSFGANILAHLSLLHPRLITTLVAFDPTITRFTFQTKGPGITPARGSAFRREVWPSREAAAESFSRSPFYKAWDPRVLEAWVQHGLRPMPTATLPATADGDKVEGQVTLATSRHQELFTFFRPLYPYYKHDGSGVDLSKIPEFDAAAHEDFDARVPFPFYRAEGANILRRLPELRPSILWVFGGTSDLSAPDKRRHKMAVTGTGVNGSGGAAAGRVAEIVMEGRGHLFPMEVPDQCADHAARWIGREMVRWREEQAEYLEWTRRPFLEKATMSEEFLRRVGPPPQRNGDTQKEKKNGEPKL